MFTDSNVCAVPTCGKKISRKHLMCAEHWAKVPAEDQAELLRMRDELRGEVPPHFKGPQADAYQDKLTTYGRKLRVATLVAMDVPREAYEP
jgi:hypothetical protein